MLSTQNRPSTSAPGDGSRTITVHDVQPRSDGSSDGPVEPHIPDVTLRLRGGPRSRPRVAWDEHVVDNENCGRKKSKICCIYHKPKEFDESSEDESSDSDTDSTDDGRARPRHAPHRHHHNFRPHSNDSSESEGAGELRNVDDSPVIHNVEHVRESNAYEAQPSISKKEKGRMGG
ncbi:hypothetical protein K439DRAFT_1627251 [Ramaria rubella]|nr:hypothetical protein K439DRAFT_1627251 [Ramaria rubella]